MPRRVLALVALGILLCPAGMRAQATVPRPSPIDYPAARREAQSPPSNDDTIATTEDDNARRRASAETNYAVWAWQYRQSTFEWQYWSTMVIFGAVIALIGFGLYFSYMQFDSAAKAGTVTSIKIGKDGLEITSPVIGLLILFVSFGFFYLYLANVYPIIELGASSATAAAVTK